MDDPAVFGIDGLNPLPPGAAIGDYSVRRVIGHGSFGITYEAHNRVPGRAAAIKEFFPSGMARRDGDARVICSDGDPEVFAWALRRFEETANSVGLLDHPNIVRLHDYIPTNGTGYLVMELLDGQTLEDWLNARPAPPRLDELRPLVDPVIAALSYAHGRGVMHSDIAPDSILMTREGRPVLIDFGWVGRGPRRGLNRPSDLVFHHFYVAPEQLRAEACATVEADVYAMGAVLYRALTGAEPVEGQERIAALILGNSPDPYVPLADRLPPGCSIRAAQAIDTALALDRGKRIRTMRDLHAALDVSVAAKAASIRAETT